MEHDLQCNVIMFMAREKKEYELHMGPMRCMVLYKVKGIGYMTISENGLMMGQACGK